MMSTTLGNIFVILTINLSLSDRDLTAHALITYKFCLKYLHLSKSSHSAVNKQRNTSCAIMSSKRGQGKGQRISRWLPADKSVTNKWFQGLIKKIETKQKDKLEKLMKLHPPAESEETALKGHPNICPPQIDPVELHPPVAALMNLILKDPGKQL